MRDAAICVAEFGELGIVAGSERVAIRGERAVRLVALLSLADRRHVSAEALVDAVWPPPDQPVTARQSLRNLVARLRSQYGSDFIASSTAGYRLGDEVASDRKRLLTAAAECRTGAGRVDPATRLAELTSTINDCAGEPWANVDLPDPLEADRQLLRVAMREVTTDAARLHARAGRHAAAIPLLDIAISLDPYREQLRLDRAHAKHLSGDRRGALREIGDARSELINIGLDVGHALSELERRLLDGVEVAPPLRSADGPSGNPSQPGLIARPRVEAILRNRWDTRLTLVRGGAGMGKSTLLRAAAWTDQVEGLGTSARVQCRSSDTADELCERIAAALLSGRLEPGAWDWADLRSAVAEVVAESRVGIIVDDCHRLDIEVARDLVDFVDTLPDGAHVVVACRPGAPVDAVAPLRRPSPSIGELDLMFDDDELLRLTGQHPDSADNAARWPALAVLQLGSDAGLVSNFLWTETLSGFSDVVRGMLSALSVIGGDIPSSLASLVAGQRWDRVCAIPLVRRTNVGVEIHELWQEQLVDSVPPARRIEIVRTASTWFCDNGASDLALDLVTHHRQWSDVNRPLLEYMTRARTRVSLGRFARLVEPAFASAPKWSAIFGAIAAFADAPFGERSGRLLDVLDTWDGHLETNLELALLVRAHEAAGSDDATMQLGRSSTRIEALAARGVAEAVPYVDYARARTAYRTEPPRRVLEMLDAPSLIGCAPLHDDVTHLRLSALLALVKPSEAGLVVEADRRAGGSAFMRFPAVMALWLSGRPDDACESLTAMRASVPSAHPVQPTWAAAQRFMHTFLGDDPTERMQPETARGRVYTSLADAVDALRRGDEFGAAAVMEQGIRDVPLADPDGGRNWLVGAALVWLLLPAERPLVEYVAASVDESEPLRLCTEIAQACESGRPWLDQVWSDPEQVERIARVTLPAVLLERMGRGADN